MGNKKKVEEEVILTVEPEVTTEEPTVEPEVTTEEEIEEEKHLVRTNGIVTAAKLNVRKEADKDGDVLTIISKGTGVGINVEKSTEKFYCVNVVVNGELATGYCMKEFIQVK